MTAHSTALQELLDKQACEELLARYARALEWVDEKALRTVFFPDAEVDYGFFEGSGEEFVSVMMEQIRACVRTWHNNGAPLLMIDGDVAQSETHGTGATVVEQDGQLVTTIMGGRYLDRLESRAGTWGIAKRTYVVDWHNSFETPAEAESATGLNFIETPGPDHPLHRRF